MGYHGYGNFSGGHGRAPFNSDRLQRMPRGIKIGLALAAVLVLVVIIVVALLAILAVLLVVRSVNGGSLPGILQGAINSINGILQSLQPLLNLVNTFRSLGG